MRNSTLHAILERLTADAAQWLDAEVEAGAEVQFELVAEPRGRGRSPLYCYRPLTERFIAERLELIAGLTSHDPAVRALASLQTIEDYISRAGGCAVSGKSHNRAEAALGIFLARVFGERNRFSFERDAFETAYAELELILYEGKSTTTVLAALLGVALDHATRELTLGDGLSLVRGEALAEAPHEAVWGQGDEPSVLAVLTVTEERGSASALAEARSRFRMLLSALRLFERGSYGLSSLAWMQTDGGAWRPAALSAGNRCRSVTFISSMQEDQLRAFCNLVDRRSALSPEFAWALSRFEMGCERGRLRESLSDTLLALRALLEPEGAGSGRLAGRLAALCAQPDERAELAERTARAISHERAVIAGTEAGILGAETLASELGEHLRCILRDVICGHLEPDLCGLADELLVEAAGAPVRAMAA